MQLHESIRIPFSLLTLFAPASLFALAQITRAEAEDSASVEWIVRVPKQTPKDATIYIIGSENDLGAWRPPGKQLVRRADGAYSARVKLPRGASVEYKVTRGSWETVEKGPKGEEIANRVIKVEKDAVVEIEVATWASGTNSGPTSKAAPVSRRTGDIRTHERFKSKSLNNERTLWVWLPPDYDSTKGERYPVLYMHDGQNLFDAATAFISIEWGADETADRLIRAGAIPPMIIVGIANTPDRMNEYTPWPDDSRKSGGKGEAYARFLIDEVKPFIDKTYRTKPDRANTGIAGSSLGGLISLHLAMTPPEVFSKCAAISPALMWADGRILKEVAAQHERLRGMRLWFDMGTSEGRQIDSFSSAVMWTRGLEESLIKGGFKKGGDYQYLEVKDGEHNEVAWAARLDQILSFLYGSKSASSTVAEE